MFRILLTLLPILGVKSASYYPRYGDTTGYPSSTIANLNNYPVRTGSSYGSDMANFPEVTRYPNYSPNYGYTTGSYSSYSTRNPFNTGTGYSTTGYNSLYNGVSSNYNQGLSRYGAGYGSGYGTGNYGSTGYGSSYGSTGSGSSYGSNGYGSSYGSNGYGSSYGSGSYGSGNFGSGSYGSGSYGSSGYGGYGTGSTLGGYSAYEAPFMRNLGGCVNRSPQNGIYVDSLMGMWYGVEYLQHLGADSHIDYIRTCIVIHISEPRDRPSTENQLYHVQHINARFRQDYRHLRLLWDEAGHTTEYALYFRNDTAGYWHVYDGQNGTMTNLPSYQQFTGTIQVLKAVNDHLVLNFCQESVNGRSPQLYTVLFSRVPGELSRWEIDSVHSLLQNKKLSTASRRMVCGNNGADRQVYSIAVSLLTCLLAFVIRSS